MPKLNDSLEALAPSGQMTYESRNPRYGRVMVVLLLLLLLLGYAYWVLTQPPAPVQQVQAPGIEHVFSIYGWGKERLSDPNGVAVDNSGNIYVADSGNHRVAVFSPAGRFRFTFGNKNEKNGAARLKKGALAVPLNVTVADNGDIYVASSIANKLSVFDSTGKFKRETKVKGIIKVIAKGNNIYATTAGQVLVMNRQGKILKRIGSKGKGAGQFELPNGLAVDKKGNIFVSDSQNMRIQIFDKNGKLIGGKGKPPIDMNDGDRLFGLGLGMALDARENIFIVDAFHHAVKIFSHDGEDYGEYGKQGQLDGEFNYPSDIASLGNGVFAVADKWNDRVQVVRITPSTAAGKAAVAVPDSRPAWFWPLLLIIILIITVLVVRWVLGRRGSARQDYKAPAL